MYSNKYMVTWLKRSINQDTRVHLSNMEWQQFPFKCQPRSKTLHGSISIVFMRWIALNVLYSFSILKFKMLYLPRSDLTYSTRTMQSKMTPSLFETAMKMYYTLKIFLKCVFNQKTIRVIVFSQAVNIGIVLLSTWKSIFNYDQANTLKWLIMNGNLHLLVVMSQD